MKTLRTIDNWIEVFGKLPSPSTETAEQTIASFILGDLVGYRDNSSHRNSDVAELANALQAYARMVQQHGVKI